MAGFEKTKLATGEFRDEYIRRRLTEGASPKDVTAEINAAGLYSGIEGKAWPESVVYAEKRKMAAPAAKSAEAAPESAAPVVAPEHEGILTTDDMREIRAEAAAGIKKKQRAAARKDALARATVELEREARLAEQRGAARGDMVDISIDLAPYAPDIRLDGEVYRHGTTRRVPRKVAAVLEEQISRSWNHQEGLQGKSENAYRRPKLQTLTGQVGGARA